VGPALVNTGFMDWVDPSGRRDLCHFWSCTFC